MSSTSSSSPPAPSTCKAGRLDHYMEILNQLSAEALTPADSAKLIKEIIRET